MANNDEEIVVDRGIANVGQVAVEVNNLTVVAQEHGFGPSAEGGRRSSVGRNIGISEFYQYPIYNVGGEADYTLCTGIVPGSYIVRLTLWAAGCC